MRNVIKYSHFIDDINNTQANRSNHSAIKGWLGSYLMSAQTIWPNSLMLGFERLIALANKNCFSEQFGWQ